MAQEVGKERAPPLASDAPVLATGSTTVRKLKDRFADVVNVKDFGAKGDGIADDTAAIKAAFTYSVAHGTPRIVLGGRFKISDTLGLTPTAGQAPILDGAGPGSTQTSLEWAGPGGIPILRLSDCIGGTIQQINFLKTASATGTPSSAVSVYQSTGTSQHVTLRNLKIGTQGVPPVAVVGVYVEGTSSGTNSEHAFESLLINGVSGAGIRFASVQNANTLISETVISGSAYGIWIPTTVYGRALGFSNNTGPDFVFPINDDFTVSCHGTAVVNGLWSELGNRLALMSGSADLIVHQGSWQMTANMNADGRLVYGDQSYAHTLVLEDFNFASSGFPPASRRIDLSTGNTAQQRVSIIRPVNWGTLDGGLNGLSMPTSNNSQWQVELDLPITTGTGASFLWNRVAHYQNCASGFGSFGFDVTRRDRPGHTLGAAASVQTTDATVTPILTFKVPPQRVYGVKVVVVGAVHSSGTDTASYELSGTLVVSPTHVYSWQGVVLGFTSESAGAVAWNVTAGINGGTTFPEIRVTGAVATTIDWSATAELTPLAY